MKSLHSIRMRLEKTRVLGLFILALWFSVLAQADYDNVQVAYFRSVRCKHNPKYAYNVSCFAKSWNRKTSTGTFVANVKIPLTSVMVRFSRNKKLFLKMLLFGIFSLKAFFSTNTEQSTETWFIWKKSTGASTWTTLIQQGISRFSMNS